MCTCPVCCLQVQPQQHMPHSNNLSPVGEPGATSLGASTCPSSSQYTMPSSDSSSVQHAPMRTMFSLLPEDNPFQDITIGSLLGWGSYGRVHRGGSWVPLRMWVPLHVFVGVFRVWVPLRARRTLQQSVGQCNPSLCHLVDSRLMWHLGLWTLRFCRQPTILPCNFAACAWRC